MAFEPMGVLAFLDRVAFLFVYYLPLQIYTKKKQAD